MSNFYKPCRARQAEFTKKIDTFLQTEYTPQQQVINFTPKKGDWYVGMFATYYAVFNVIKTHKEEMIIDYWMVFPDRTEKVQASIGEIRKDTWKPIRKPKEITWEAIKEEYGQD